MIPEYMRFYGGTLDEVLNLYTRAFYALVNSMKEIIAREKLDDITTSGVIHSENGKTIVEALHKQRRGLGAIVQEVKIVKKVRGK